MFTINHFYGSNSIPIYGIRIKFFCLFWASILISHSSDTFAKGASIDSLARILITQPNDTNRVKTLNAISTYWMDSGDTEKARSFADKAKSLANELGFEKGKARANALIATSYYLQQDYPKAVNYMEFVVEYYEKAGHKQGLGDAYSTLAFLYFKNSDYSNMIRTNFKNLKLSEENKDYERIADLYQEIGGAYKYLNDTLASIKHLNDALRMRVQLGDSNGMGQTYISLGEIYASKGLKEKAYDYFLNAYEIYEGLGIRARGYGKPWSLQNIGNLHEKEGDEYLAGNDDKQAHAKYRLALYYYSRAWHLYDSSDFEMGFAESHLFIGNIYLKLGSLQQAEAHFKAALELSKKHNNKEEFCATYRHLAKLDSAMGEFYQSLLHYQLYVTYRDSLINVENIKKSTQALLDYANEKKAMLVQAEQAKKDLKQKNIRTSMMMGIGGLILFSLMVFRQRNRIFREKLRSEKLLLNILPSEVADELKIKGSSEARLFEDVTVIFTDFKSFTTVSERLTPQELVDELHACFSAFDRIISKHHVEKIKTVGDAYLAVAGLPEKSDRHAANALAAALEIRDFMQQRKCQCGEETFDIRIGIHSGSVVAGIVGVKKFAYDIWGDTVNIAARMEQNCEPGMINISKATFDLIKDEFACEPRGKLKVKNKGEMEMYYVLDALFEAD